MAVQMRRSGVLAIGELVIVGEELHLTFWNYPVKKIMVCHYKIS
ncbi:hypothetical protein HNQ56_001585 [Anaerotaenia torta]